MSESAFLKPGAHGDVAEFTGAHTKKRQLHCLRQNGVRHWINAAGWPVVAWAEIEGRQEKRQDAREWRSRALDDAA